MHVEANNVKPGDDCPYCGHGILESSPSEAYLVCRKCGRIVVLRDDEIQTN
jgi:DNA-directed RNA polymerase subunit RPC12/RpoP